MADNPAAFKLAFNAERVRSLAGHLERVSPGFDGAGLVADVVPGLASRELKARSQLIAEQVAARCPPHWDEVLLACLGAPVDPDAPASADADGSGVRGWMCMALGEAVVLLGLDEPERALPVLHGLTQRFSAEFAIRPFLLAHPEVTLAALHRWVDDPSPHVRRLVSEGSRPRLPWGVRLQPFVEDPSPVLPLLDRLVDDPSPYVRKSVANHLNDVCKDHPALALERGRRWWSEAPHRQQTVRHGLRTLLKAGDAGALALLGLHPPALEATLSIAPSAIALGEAVTLDVTLTSTGEHEQALMIDYVVHLVRAQGTGQKVFKWTRRTLAPGETQQLTRRHPMKVITNRRYYPGRHVVELQVNGQLVARSSFTLLDGSEDG